MSLQQIIGNYVAYNEWANQRLIEYLKTKPAEIWTAAVPSSFNSIAKTLNHILATQEYWFSVVTETENTSTRWDDSDPDAEALFNSLIKHSKLMQDTFQQLSEDELSKHVLIESPWFTSNLPKYEYIVHVLNHSTYHRGQIITIGRNLGFTDAPNTDYNFYNVERTATLKTSQN